MNSPVYYFNLLVFFIVKIKTSIHDTAVIREILNYDTNECYLKINSKTGKNYSLTIIKEFGIFVWEALTRNVFFVSKLKKYYSLSKFNERNEIYKKYYLKKLIYYLNGSSEDYIIYNKISESENDFLDIVVRKTSEIFYSFRLCHKDKLDNSDSLLQIMREIIDKGICIETNSIDNRLYIYEKWCIGFLSYYNRCLNEEFKQRIVDFAEENKNHISKSDCIDSNYDFKHFKFTNKTTFMDLCDAFNITDFNNKSNIASVNNNNDTTEYEINVYTTVNYDKNTTQFNNMLSNDVSNTTIQSFFNGTYLSNELETSTSTKNYDNTGPFTTLETNSVINDANTSTFIVNPIYNTSFDNNNTIIFRNNTQTSTLNYYSITNTVEDISNISSVSNDIKTTTFKKIFFTTESSINFGTTKLNETFNTSVLTNTINDTVIDRNLSTITPNSSYNKTQQANISFIENHFVKISGFLVMLGIIVFFIVYMKICKRKIVTKTKEEEIFELDDDWSYIRTK
ncbi:putative SP-containing membrane protein [Vairimorpha necatrix]|uniref:SP-containing membrane protein n=1 Tax=Vairimorpha necatrix TaxID=6039 RepID=A0AAX4JA50_9MICR